MEVPTRQESAVGALCPAEALRRSIGSPFWFSFPALPGGPWVSGLSTAGPALACVSLPTSVEQFPDPRELFKGHCSEGPSIYPYISQVLGIASFILFSSCFISLL